MLIVYQTKPSLMSQILGVGYKMEKQPVAVYGNLTHDHMVKSHVLYRLS